MAKNLIREEQNGFFKFNRDTKVVEFLSQIESKEASDFVQRPLNASGIALTAPFTVWHETTQNCNLNCKPCGKSQFHEN